MKTYADHEPQGSRRAASALQDAQHAAGSTEVGNARDAAQRQRIGAAFGPAVTQRAGEEEEPLQGRFVAVQRVEEEEPLQGRFDTAQRVEEEEPLQGRFDTVQRAKANDSGLPNTLKAGVESLSGVSMDGVQVHYNSSKPAQLNALAYAQGRDIHVAPGQEQHLPHEAWHIAQQAQGRVQPTTQMAGGVAVNDDAGLETEADVMGARALAAGGQTQQRAAAQRQAEETGNPAAQLRPNKYVDPAARRHYTDGWGTKVGVTKDAELKPKVPDDVAGDGSLTYGLVEAPDSEQDPKDRRFKKEFTIEYADGAKPDETKIYHSGPTGRRHYFGPQPT
jgi:hypothetical protein